MEGEKLKGDVGDYLFLMKKHTLQGREDIYNEKIIVIHFSDGVEHLNSKKNITSLISFSSTMFTSKY